METTTHTGVESLTTEQKLGAFPGCWAIHTKTPGGPSLHLSLIFSLEDNSVTGHAQVTQALSSPVILRAQVHGSYTRLLVRHSPYYLMFGQGQPDNKWPVLGGVGPVLPPTLEFQLNTPTTFSLGNEEGELLGTGRFRYRDQDTQEWGPWYEGTVEEVSCS